MVASSCKKLVRKNRSKILQETRENLLGHRVAEIAGAQPAGFLPRRRFRAALFGEAGTSRRQKARPFTALRNFTTLLFFVAAKEFVALDGGNYADGAFIARLRALDTAEAAYADRACQGDLIRQG